MLQASPPPSANLLSSGRMDGAVLNDFIRLCLLLRQLALRLPGGSSFLALLHNWFVRRGWTPRSQGDYDLLALSCIFICMFGLSMPANVALFTDYPLHTLIWGICVVAIAALVLHTTLARLHLHSWSEQAHPLLPSRDQDDIDRCWEADRSSHVPVRAFLSPLCYRACALVACLIGRLFVAVYLLRYRECQADGVEVGILLLFVLWRHGSMQVVLNGLRPWSNLWNSARWKLEDDLLRGRNLACGSMTTLTFILISKLASDPSSTFICPSSLGTSRWTLGLQGVALCLDFATMLGFEALLGKFSAGPDPISQHLDILPPSIALVSASIFFFIARCTKLVARSDNMTFGIDSIYVGKLTSASPVALVLLLAATHLSFRNRSFELAVYATTAIMASNLIRGNSNWSAIHPGGGPWVAVPAIFLFAINIGFVVTDPTRPNTSSVGGLMRPSRVIVIWAVLSMCAALYAPHFAGRSGDNSDSRHPIDSLMEQGALHYNTWKQQIATSRNFTHAVAEYNRRYGLAPPPGFDVWYRYATQRQSAIIDDFDTIMEDLHPFWSFTPAEIRQRVAGAVSESWNELVEIQIRSGKASIGRVKPTHRWMAEGVVNLLNPFVKHLPDMDAAFNINDESRIAVPYNQLRQYQDGSQRAIQTHRASQSSWSNDRAARLNESDQHTSFHPGFTDYSFQKSFWRHGSVSCSPDTLARRYPNWPRNTYCGACTAEHTYEGFLTDWTRAADPCHQPDLADLHGFYLSPSAFKPTHELIPVFSQARASGYQDILYPSPWNYNEKVKYDPSGIYMDASWADKANTLFWRGTGTEGYSDRGTWKGMTRQRLVHLAQNSHVRTPVLLPWGNAHSPELHEFDSSASDARIGRASGSGSEGWSYMSLTSHEFVQHPVLTSRNATLDLAFSPFPENKHTGMARCWGRDCQQQRAELGVAESSADFQAHWQYRYLMDVDGAGFSGRFLPFLRSRSLPFKTALFREWHAPRLFAWRHFVPIDLRLHGLWSTLAYFAAGFGQPRDPAGSGPHDPGEYIAQEGREWAAQVLRKEDMEIYFFRLLLEYGRLTDDRRDELGLVL